MGTTTDLRFELADAANEAQLRQLFRDTPLSGDIRLALEHEPNALHAAAVSGDRYQLILAFGNDRQDLLGAGARYELDVYVNGEERRIGYLGQLRIAGGLRQRRTLLLEAYRTLHRYHVTGNAAYYLTTIIAANDSTRRLFEAQLGDMPTYRPLERMVTLTIPTRAGARARKIRRQTETASEAQFAGIRELLAEHGRKLQFYPVWSDSTLHSSDRCRDLLPSDFVVCRERGALRGCLALWDQRSFKQSVIRGYAGRLETLRPAYNLAAPLLRRPRLPKPGTRLECAMLSHVAVEPGDVDTLDTLIRQACQQAARRGIDYAIIAFAERNPLCKEVRKRFPCHSYASMIYIVYWDDGKDAAAEVDGRVPHPEVAIL